MKIIEIIRPIIYWVRYLKDYIYDLNRFVMNSNIEHKNIKDTEKLVAKIISLYHVIEKGLSMEFVKPGFGQDRVKKLIEYVSMYSLRVDKRNWDIQVLSSIKVLAEYKTFNDKNLIINNDLNKFLNKFDDYKRDRDIQGGTKTLKHNLDALNDDVTFDSVIENRSSIRNFGHDNIEFNIVKRAIIQAQNAPSTCNRQSSRVLYTLNKDLIKGLLHLQGGSRGFSDKISCLLLVCSDAKCYQGSGDRHSGIIDASLFAMTLMYSLTKNNIANISLNWSKTAKEDLALRDLVTIPTSYSVIFLIGLGSYNNKNIKVPVSNKNSLNTILKEVKNKS